MHALPQIKAVLHTKRALTIESYSWFFEQLEGPGVGWNTLTKFLYFLGFTLEGYQCLILDSKIIEVLRSRLFFELSALSKINEFNKKAKYIDYIQRITELAEAEGYKPDQLELFLFEFGKNLKKSGGNMRAVAGL